MLSAVLRSKPAIQVCISIMKAFVAMRNYIATTTTVTAELAEIRAKLALLERTDEDNAEAIKRPFGRYAQGIGQYLSGNRRPVCQNPAGPQAAPADRI